MRDRDLASEKAAHSRSHHILSSNNGFIQKGNPKVRWMRLNYASMHDSISCVRLWIGDVTPVGIMITTCFITMAVATVSIPPLLPTEVVWLVFGRHTRS